MNALLPLPTRRDEVWRYSDLDAVAKLWPLNEPYRISVNPNAEGQLSLLLDGPTDTPDIRDYVIEIAPHGRFDMHLLIIGSELGRVTLDVTLQEGAQFNLKAALVGGGKQTIELVTTVRHAQPSATSSQTVRAIAAGKATTSYLGQIAVARHAQKTDAAQSFKAMLLDRTATANAKPELEIFADDVKCAHGASVGELDKEALFYLASRGFSPAAARGLMLRAFISGLFDDLPDETKRHRFEAAALAKLEALA